MCRELLHFALFTAMIGTSSFHVILVSGGSVVGGGTVCRVLTFYQVGILEPKHCRRNNHSSGFVAGVVTKSDGKGIRRLLFTSFVQDYHGG